MIRYAQINLQTGKVESDSYLAGCVEAENMKGISDDFDLKNKRWNGKDWEAYDPEKDVAES